MRFQSRFGLKEGERRKKRDDVGGPTSSRFLRAVGWEGETYSDVGDLDSRSDVLGVSLSRLEDDGPARGEKKKNQERFKKKKKSSFPRLFARRESG